MQSSYIRTDMQIYYYFFRLFVLQTKLIPIYLNQQSIYAQVLIEATDYASTSKRCVLHFVYTLLTTHIKKATPS